MAEPRVVVVGSLHYDIMVEAGDWPAQGETIVARHWGPKLGGKGRNQAVAARRAGAAVAMVGRIGHDDFGRALRDDLVARGIDTRWLGVGTAGSGVSVAITDRSRDYRAFIVSGANLELGAGDLPDEDALRDAGILVLQNEVPEGANLAAAERARAAGVRVLLNAAPFRALPPELLRCVDVLVVNAVEAAQLDGGAEPTSLDRALAVARRLRQLGPAVLVTAGGAGSAYCGPEGDVALPAEPVKVVSSHGAGDAFVGTLAARLAAGMAIELAMQGASAAAARLISGAGE